MGLHLFPLSGVLRKIKCLQHPGDRDFSECCNFKQNIDCAPGMVLLRELQKRSDLSSISKTAGFWIHYWSGEGRGMGVAPSKKYHRLRTLPYRGLITFFFFLHRWRSVCSVAFINFWSYEMVDFRYFTHIFIVSVGKQGHRGPHSMISEIYLDYIFLEIGTLWSYLFSYLC